MYLSGLGFTDLRRVDDEKDPKHEKVLKTASAASTFPNTYHSGRTAGLSTSGEKLAHEPF